MARSAPVWATYSWRKSYMRFKVARIERVDVGAVGEREPLALRACQVLSEIGAVPAGLLVLELAGHEHRHVDFLARTSRGPADRPPPGCRWSLLGSFPSGWRPRRAAPDSPRRSDRLLDLSVAHAGRGRAAGSAFCWRSAAHPRRSRRSGSRRVERRRVASITDSGAIAAGAAGWSAR